MKPALSEQDTLMPVDWQQFAQGAELAARIEHLLEPWWQQIFGYYLLKVGDLSCQVDTKACKIRRQICLGLQTKQADLLAEPDALPVQEHCIDAVLLTHCLEFQPDPHHIVREAHRVLVSDGYLILTGFNPYSVAGALRYLPWLKNRYPWCGRFFSASRVRDWLNLVGFEVLSEQHFFCSSMLTKDFRASPVQRWVERYLHFFGASYLLIARKRELPLTPIRPTWRLTSGFQTTVKEVSARQRCPDQY